MMRTCSLILATLGLGAAMTVSAEDLKPAGKTDTQAPAVLVRLLGDKGELSPPTASPRVIKTDAEWRRQLTPDQYKIARAKGTEPAFCGAFYDQKKPGVYYCVCCGLPLFTSEAKYHSGTGWPSFFSPIALENVITQTDLSHGMTRTEILCVRCDCHLGHLFEDGPRPTGLRYCLNSASLIFKEDKHFKDGTRN